MASRSFSEGWRCTQSGANQSLGPVPCYHAEQGTSFKSRPEQPLPSSDSTLIERRFSAHFPCATEQGIAYPKQGFSGRGQAAVGPRAIVRSASAEAAGAIGWRAGLTVPSWPRRLAPRCVQRRFPCSLPGGAHRDQRASAIAPISISAARTSPERTWIPARMHTPWIADMREHKRDRYGGYRDDRGILLQIMG